MTFLVSSSIEGFSGGLVDKQVESTHSMGALSKDITITERAELVDVQG